MINSKHITRILHESAEDMKPSYASCQSILGQIMPEAVQEGRVSYATAREKVVFLTQEASRQRKSKFVSLGIIAIVAVFILCYVAFNVVSIIPETSVPLNKNPEIGIVE
ncbi:MAG: hypothetical protein FWG43_05400 [Clostridiales bacterium]|nr:hypothetical protein [Clostridiales bacterium]